MKCVFYLKCDTVERLEILEAHLDDLNSDHIQRGIDFFPGSAVSLSSAKFISFAFSKEMGDLAQTKILSKGSNKYANLPLRLNNEDDMIYYKRAFFEAIREINKICPETFAIEYYVNDMDLEFSRFLKLLPSIVDSINRAMSIGLDNL